MSFSIGGLASGLDTNQIIQQLMQIESQPFVRLEASKKNINAQQSTFRSLNTKLKTLQDIAFDLSLASSFRGVTSTSSDETVARVTSTSSASTGEFDLIVNQLAKAHVVQSKVTARATDEIGGLQGSSFKIAIGNNEFKTITVSENATTYEEMLEDIKTQINASKVGINASVIETTEGRKQLILTSRETGTTNTIKFAEADTELLDALGISLTENGDVVGGPDGNVAQPGQDAKIIVNGIEIVRSSNTITNVIEGVTLNLLKESDEQSSARAKIEVKTDTEQVTEKLEEFVNAYNEVVTMIRGNLQKDSKLQGNATLRNLDTQLFNWTNSKVGSDDDAYNFLFELGITIDKGITVGSEMTGKMSIDKKVLKEKLEADPDAFMNFFRGEEGLAKTLDKNLRTWTSSANGILTKAIQSFDSEISFIDDRIEQMSQRLAIKEQNLRKQFVAMEVALAKSQAQQMWLSSQLGQLGGWGSNNQG